MNRREWITATASLALLSKLHSAAFKYEVATFDVEVTPPLKHPCMGGGIAPVAKIDDPLQALGFVLLGAGKPIVWCAVDWCEIRNDAYDRWRDVIAEKVKTDRERVMVCALHQHDAPIADLTAQKILDEASAKGAICDLKFHEQTVQRVARGIEASLKSTRTITRIGTAGSAVDKVASNRRFLDESGKVRYDRMSRATDPKIRDAEIGTIDPDLKTLVLYDGDDPVIALHAYATHPMSYYGRGAVTADFVGIARRMIQREFPKMQHVYLSGCSGNVTAGKFNDGSEGNRPVLAKRLAEAMTKNLKSVESRPISKIDFRCEKLDLPLRETGDFSEAKLREKLKQDDKPFQQCLAALGLSWRQRVLKKQSIDVPVIDFGSAAMLLLPAEAYVEFQLHAQSVRMNDFIMTAGYGESGPGYIPIERAWKEGDSNLGDWCWVDPGSEERMKAIIEKVLVVKSSP